jgi:AraC-like DNA-binding protein
MIFIVNPFINFLVVLMQIIIYSGIVQGFYSAFILSHTKRKNPANRYLAYLLVVLSFCIIHSEFIIPYFHQFQKTTFHIKEPFIMLVVPFIWLYVNKLSEPSFGFRPKHVLHFAPFAVLMSFSLIYFMHKVELENTERFELHIRIFNVIIYIAAFCQYLFYLIYISKLIRKFESKALSELSNTENIDPAWLKIFLYTFVLVFILLIGMMVIALHNINFGLFNILVSIIFSIVIFVLGYKGLFQQTIITDELETEIVVSAVKPSEIIATETKVNESHLNLLYDYMLSQKPYHDPELTLTSLAAQLKIGRNMLSELINSGTGGNFYDFVNKYRVDEVKQLMETPKFKDYTILAIAFEAGFPSKSTFNSIFKKFTGLTPSEYRNRLM